MGKNYKIIALEDNPIYRGHLRMILDKLNYKTCKMLDSPKGFMNIIEACKPDVILMNINIENETGGIELTKKINRQYDIPTIFLTSYDDMLTFKRAKKALPYFYLVKPYKEYDLERAIELAILHKKEKLSRPQGTEAASCQHLFFRTNNKLQKIDYKDIKLVTAIDKYCHILLKDRKIIIKERLKNLLSRLPEDQFIQVHRSHIINIEAIVSLNNTATEVTISNQTLKLGRTYKAKLLSRISLIG
ncbi:response regulator transcription factor [Zunongwangia sp. F363]|uniref:Response regulator transcription factor n=1 Tax=Autumnicola tepida TaxID=3075595 RepID=A0ABU3C8Z3_9FLAO|nr:response regulator transcription factor [Zunongwangia sp. F363]MDT0642816.1 response regulator transcription factor [Zunongwangia sp. F363]